MKWYIKFVLVSIDSDIPIQEPGCLVSHIDDDESIGVVISSDENSYIQVLWSNKPIDSFDRKIRSHLKKSLSTILIGRPNNITNDYYEALIENIMTPFRDHGKIIGFKTNCFIQPTSHKKVIEVQYSTYNPSMINYITIEL